MTRYIVGIGEVLWDMLPSGGRIGGAPANFAFHAKEFGLNSIAVSAIGDDPLGEDTVEALSERGMKFLLPKVPFPTGKVQVSLDGKGVPTYEIMRDVAWDNIPFTAEISEIAQNARAVCWGSLAQRSPVSRQTISRFIAETPEDCLKVFDINLRQDFYSKYVIEDSLSRCDILKINDEELETVSSMLDLGKGSLEERCRSLIGKYALGMVVLTCGTCGSYVFSPGRRYFLETPKVSVDDTVGAGDSFTGAFCAALLRGREICEAHRIAVLASAYVCTRSGAMPHLPEDITSLLK